MSWVSWFCGLKGNGMFCEVDRTFLEDPFNSAGLQEVVPYFSHAMDIVLDLQDSNGGTALMHAVVAGHPAIVQRLLKAGASLGLRDANCWTALRIAEAKGHAECVRVIKEHVAAVAHV